ncbi:MAG: hypothetical protein RL769_797, partial [Pseudomonadota bacterium]
MLLSNLNFQFLFHSHIILIDDLEFITKYLIKKINCYKN